MDKYAYRDAGGPAINIEAIYGQQNASMLGIQTASTQVTLLSQISSAHALADSLGEVVSALEKKLSPILSSSYPDGQKEAGGVPACDPPAIEEMDRLLNRLRSVIAYVDSIERRTRI